MIRFISTAGPNKAPLAGLDVRFWGSALTLADALELKASVDQEPELAKYGDGVKTYLAHSLVRKDQRKFAKVFDSKLQHLETTYLDMYIVDPAQPNARPIDENKHASIGFDVFSAPSGKNWHDICLAASKILEGFSSGPPGSQV